MKYILSLLISFSFIAILLYGNKNSNHTKTFRNQIPLSSSTLDSLQGLWVWTDHETDEVDTTNKVRINNRLWISEFFDDNNVFVKDTALMFFSDTIIIGDTILFSQIDTTSVTGDYIIHVVPLQNGQGFEHHGSWEILGIVKIDGETYFSMWPAPYGTARQVQSFKKVQ